MPSTTAQRQVPWASEVRAAPEFGAFVASVGPLLLTAPRGDGHPVLVLPGMGGDDLSTRPLRWFLRRLGYHTHGWRLGINLGPTERSLDRLAARFERVVGQHDARISIIGWSLGGLYARGIARRVPQHVRQVITLGSPLRGMPDAAPTVPVTSIYSRTDAIVPWPAAQVEDRPLRENVEVRGSHLGLGHNPTVLLVVADRLAQPFERWVPYRTPNWARRLYPTG